MNLNRTDIKLDRAARNKENENWNTIEGSVRKMSDDFNNTTQKLEDDFNNVVESISDQVVEKLVDTSKLDWQEPVDTIEDLPSVDPIGTVRQVREATSEGVSMMYRKYEDGWKVVQEYDATAINEVDSRLTAQLAETMQELTVISEATVHVENFPRFTNEFTDSPRINRAIEYAITNGIRNVELPDRTLLMNSPLIVDGNNIKITGGHNTILRRADGYTADIIRSVQNERSRITDSLENVIFEQFTIDGVDKTATGITLTRFTRGCVIRGVQIKNCRDGIDIDDSWSFSLIGNVLNVFSGDGIKFNTGKKEVNAVVIQGNTIRNAVGYGIYAPNLHAVDITGNTFELNGINVLLGGQGGSFKGNYCEMPSSNNVILGTPSQALEGFEVGGNYVNGASSGSGFNLINVINCFFSMFYYTTINYPYVFNNSSVIDSCIFYLPKTTKTAFYNTDTAESSNLGNTFGGNNSVYFDFVNSQNTNDTGSRASLAEWRINTKTIQDWSRVGKLTSASDEFEFDGRGVTAFKFNKRLITKEITFNGTTSIEATKGSRILPSNPAGFITINIGGTNYKLPYYNI